MNYFDQISLSTQKNIIHDVQKMALHECSADITRAEAERVARTLLRGKHDSSALYNVSTARLRRLVGA